MLKSIAYSRDWDILGCAKYDSVYVMRCSGLEYPSSEGALGADFLIIWKGLFS